MKATEMQRLWDSAAGGPVGVMERFEAAFCLPEEVENPYDPDEAEFWAVVEGPEGERETLPGFWYEGFVRTLRNGEEILLPGREREWRFRFAPRRPGKYRYFVICRLLRAGREYRWPAGGTAGFAAADHGRRGFLRVSGSDPALLEYSDGSPFWGIGHNLCGWEWGGSDNRGGSYDFDRWLGELAQNGGNLTHFHLGEGNQLEWTPDPGELPWSADWAGLGRYNAQTAWKMDARVARAEELGIFFRLTLLHWEDFDNETDRFPDWGWDRNPYNRANGGPVADVSEFFADPAARGPVRKLLRYVAARWGTSANLLAYELWNEVDAPEVCWKPGDDYRSRAAEVQDWHREMALELKRWSPRHMVTTSFADSRLDAAVWALPELDLTTVHRYTYFNADFGGRQFDTEGALRRVAAERREICAKPLLFGEFALSPGGDIQKDRDPAGIEFQNQLWASLMVKAAGTAMHWTWGSYVHANGLTAYYAPLRRFVEGEDLRGMVPFSADTGRLLCLGLRGKGRALLWCRDPARTFENREPPVPIAAGETVTPGGLPDGSYWAEYLDPADGSRRIARAALCGGMLKLPGFTGSLAVKLRPEAEVRLWESRDLPQPRLGSDTEFCGRQVRLLGGGEGFRAEGDAARLLLHDAPGDFDLRVRLAALSKTGKRARAGLILRDGDGPRAVFLALLLDPYGRAELLERTAAGFRRAPLEERGGWLSLRRRGGDAGAYLSPDGGHWRRVGGFPEELQSGGNGQKIGLAVASGDSFRYAQAHFWLDGGAPAGNYEQQEERQ